MKLLKINTDRHGVKSVPQVSVARRVVIGEWTRGQSVQMDKQLKLDAVRNMCTTKVPISSTVDEASERDLH